MATPTRPCPYCGAAVLMNAAACGTCGRPMPAAPGGPPAGGGGGGPAKTMFGYAAPVRPGAPPPGPPAPAPARPPGPPPAGGHPPAAMPPGAGFPPGPPAGQYPGAGGAGGQAPPQPGFPPQQPPQPGFPPQPAHTPPPQFGGPPQPQHGQFGGPPQGHPPAPMAPGAGFPPQPQHGQFGGPPQQPPGQFGGPPQGHPPAPMAPGAGFPPPPQHQPPQFGGPPHGQHGQFGGPPQQPGFPPPQQPGFPPPPQHQPPPPQFGGPPQQPPQPYGAPPQPYGAPPQQPGFPPPPAQGYPPPGANPYAAPVADLPGPLDNIARALPGSAPGTIFGIPLSKLRDPDLQKKALFILGAALIVSIFVPASFSPFAFAFKGNAFKGLVWPLIAGGSYLLVAAAPPHIKQKVPPIVLEWLPFGVSYAGIVIVGTGAAAGFGEIPAGLSGASGLGALNGVIAAASTFYALAMATLIFGLLARLQNPQDQVARIIMAVGAGMLVLTLIDLFGALFKFSVFGESTPFLGIHNQLFFFVVLIGVLTLLYLVPPAKLPPALKAIDSLAPLVAALLLAWLPLQLVLMHISALLDDDRAKFMTVILSMGRSLLALLAYFGVLMLTAPAAYDSFMAMFKKGQGGQPPAPPPPQGGYPPPGGGYPPPGGGYPPPQGGGYPPPQGGGWPQQ